MYSILNNIVFEKGITKIILEYKYLFELCDKYNKLINELKNNILVIHSNRYFIKETSIYLFLQNKNIELNYRGILSSLWTNLTVCDTKNSIFISRTGFL